MTWDNKEEIKTNTTMTRTNYNITNKTWKRQLERRKLPYYKEATKRTMLKEKSKYITNKKDCIIITTKDMKLRRKDHNITNYTYYNTRFSKQEEEEIKL